MVQLRDTVLTDSGYLDLAMKVAKICQPYNAKLILNASPELINTVPAQGIHLNSRRLFQFNSRPVAKKLLISASCHNARELEQAALIDVDFVFISPIRETSTHSNTAILGWEQFAELTALANRPVFALGGVLKSDLQKAQAMGARGIAGIRDFFFAG